MPNVPNKTITGFEEPDAQKPSSETVRIPRQNQTEHVKANPGEIEAADAKKPRTPVSPGSPPLDDFDQVDCLQPSAPPESPEQVYVEPRNMMPEVVPSAPAQNDPFKRPPGTSDTTSTVTDLKRDVLEPGNMLGQYKIDTVLGRGGQGAVYLATHVWTKEKAAVKVLLNIDQNIPEDVRNDPKKLQAYEEKQHEDLVSLLQEGATLRALRDPHVVPCLDVGIDAQGRAYLAMKPLTGGDLLSKMTAYHDLKLNRKIKSTAASKKTVIEPPPDTKTVTGDATVESEVHEQTNALSDQPDVQTQARETVTLEQLLNVLIDAGKGLASSHKLKVVHRDVKPENILLEGNTAYICDFGLGRRFDTKDDLMAGKSVGTPNYMSPEQWLAPENVDHRTDIYGLGAILYEILTGIVPYYDQLAKKKPVSEQTSKPKTTSRWGAKEKTSEIFDKNLLSATPKMGDWPKKHASNDVRPVPPTPILEINPGANRELVAIAEKAIQREPDHRYQTMDEFVADLERYQRNEIPLALKPTRRARALRWIYNHPKIFGLIAAAPITLGGAVYAINGYVTEQRELRQQAEAERAKERKEFESKRDSLRHEASTAWAVAQTKTGNDQIAALSSALSFLSQLKGVDPANTYVKDNESIMTETKTAVEERISQQREKDARDEEKINIERNAEENSENNAKTLDQKAIAAIDSYNYGLAAEKARAARDLSRTEKRVKFADLQIDKDNELRTKRTEQTQQAIYDYSQRVRSLYDGYERGAYQLLPEDFEEKIIAPELEKLIEEITHPKNPDLKYITYVEEQISAYRAKANSLRITQHDAAQRAIPDDQKPRSERAKRVGGYHHKVQLLDEKLDKKLLTPEIYSKKMKDAFNWYLTGKEE